MINRIKYCALTTISDTMETFVISCVEYLYNNGYDITLICNMSGEFISKQSKNFNYYSIDIERGFNLYKTVKSIFVLYKIFKKENFEIIQYGAENVSFCASIAGFMAKIPVRIYEHWGSRYIGMKGFSRIIVKLIERTIATFSTDVRQVSFENMNICIADNIYNSNKVKVNGKGGTIGVNLDLFNIDKKTDFNNDIRKRYSIENNVFIFGYVGTVRVDKGSNELLLAFKKLSENVKNIMLIMVGDIYDDDPIDPDLKRWADESDEVIFTGRVSDVYEYMASFNALVHPSYREGFGMVLQEASAFALPIITTNIPGPRELIIHNKTGLLVEKANFRDLFEKMMLLYNDIELRNRLGKNAYNQVVKHFDRKIKLQEILNDRNELYEKRVVKK